MDWRVPAAPLLNKPGMGIYLIRDDTEVVTGGWITAVDRKREDTTDQITFTGRDDNVWLHARLASPQPGASAPPYSATEHDVRTGQCSTVLRQYVDYNAGPSAVSARRVSWGGVGGLVLGTNPLVGTTITGRARWQNLLELLAELALAGGDIGFRVLHTGTAMEFQVFQPADKSSTVHFSHELGNLAGYQYATEIPAVDHVYVGGGGEGTARIIREKQDPFGVAAHGRFEAFRDQRHTSDTGELDQAGQEHLDENAGKVTLSLTPLDTVQQAYRTHWDLGDKVTAFLDDEPVVERIREVKFTFDESGHPEAIEPVLGTPGAGALLDLFTRLERQNRRITSLERR